MSIAIPAISSALILSLTAPVGATTTTASAHAAGFTTTPVRVIVQEDTAPGERPEFVVVDTDVAGYIELVLDPTNDRVMLDGSAQLMWQPPDPDYPSQWEHSVTGMESVWDTTRGSYDVVIAIVDSGV